MAERAGRAGRAGPTKRLAVLQGHLNPPPSYSCSGGTLGGGGKSKATKPTAPMTSKKDNVQKAFPRKR